MILELGPNVLNSIQRPHLESAKVWFPALQEANWAGLIGTTGILSSFVCLMMKSYKAAGILLVIAVGALTLSFLL